jgi:hypothetical protein
MMTLLNQVITGAVTARLSGTLQMLGSAQMSYPDCLILQGQSTSTEEMSKFLRDRIQVAYFKNGTLSDVTKSALFTICRAP